ncbi:MAG: hypothetical protein AMK69_26140 [Nitrospira bacterium SG8_3]|nr:MAG: hypothetical protein AMK69_26140 [Nitrospira bacterium SG8_3]
MGGSIRAINNSGRDESSTGDLLIVSRCSVTQYLGWFAVFLTLLHQDFDGLQPGAIRQIDACILQKKSVGLSRISQNGEARKALSGPTQGFGE